MTKDRPLSYWVSVARMGFENDFNRLFDELGISRAELANRVDSSPAYVSKVLNGTAANFQLSTMAKWARAIGAVVQIRVVQEGKEVVRVVDYETARMLDDISESRLQDGTAEESPTKLAAPGPDGGKPAPSRAAALPSRYGPPPARGHRRTG